MSEENEVLDNGLEKKNDDINHVELDEQMRIAYLDYAMSVIVSRALPDARDGLKPVHRRILYAMNDMGNRWNQPHKKSARIVGEVLGKYHPHGDASIYDAMARMAQDFSMRYLLVDGQGNFGSIDGDSPAAMRYTEARMTKLTDELLADIDKETIDFMDNFDGTLQEPTVLPAKVPNLLLNGSSGIAVGMATNIPPHNLREINSALAYMIDHYDAIDEITVDDLMQFVQGPDFPTGGVIVGRSGIVQAYSTGKGHVIVRAKSHVEESPHRNGCFDIVVNEIPYQVNKTTLIERIAELVREGKIDTIHDLRDESDREGMRIVIELKKNAQPKAVLNQLYKHTALQSTFGVQMLALVEDKPEYLSLKRALEIFIKHRLEVVVRRAQYDLKKAKARAHILEGLLIALDNLDEVIRIIRNASDTDDARNKLMSRFGLDEVQAQAILDMQLRRLTALERSKVEEEMKQLQATIEYLNLVVSSPAEQLKIVEKETDEVTAKFGDDRRTTIEPDAIESLDESDLVSERGVFVTLTENGYIKRVDANTYRQYNRGAHGVTGHSLKHEDTIAKMLFVNTHDTMLFFTDKGKVYAEKVYHIDEGSRTDKGTPVINIINIEGGEKVTAMLALSDKDETSCLIMATKNGKIKSGKLSDYRNIRSNGLKAINLEDDDELTWVNQTDGNMSVLLVTENGKCLKYPENKLRAMGRNARGVKAMKIEEGDRLISVCTAKEDDKILIVSEKGIGKRTLVSGIPAHGRGTGGVRITNVRAFDVTGKLVAAEVMHENDDVTFITSTGNVIRLKGSIIPVTGRTAKGVILVKMDGKATVAAVTANDADAIKDPEEKAEEITQLPENTIPEDPADSEEDAEEIEAEEEITEDAEDPEEESDTPEE